MSSLKIINSPNSRILTQCDHCQHVMRTPADALYYLVECPSCFKDFIVKRYKEAGDKTRHQFQEVRQKVASTANVSDEAFIKAVYQLSWPVYKFSIALSLVFGTFTFGFNGDIRILIWCTAGILLITILHYFILCAGGMYFRDRESRYKVSSGK